MLATRDLNRLFDGLWAHPSVLVPHPAAPVLARRPRPQEPAPARWPRLDWHEEEDRFVFRADLPGMQAADLEISFDDGVLRVAGERADDVPEGHAPQRRERFVGRFERRLRLTTPVVAADATARFEHGVLTITVPKAPEPQPLKIAVLPAEPQT